MIGVIADDFTGGTDVAVFFRRSGLRTIIVFGVPGADAELPDHDALVVALKTRTIEPAAAVADSLAAVRWLRGHGADQIFFKYCSTFDSTADGNIGPVADALADHLDAAIAVVVPASPAHGRTQYLGHLFVQRQLLSDSPMRHHPLTPMTNPRMAEVMAAQTGRPVGLIPLPTVRAGADAIRAELDRLGGEGFRYAVVDAIDDNDLELIGRAVAGDRLVTGAAGLAGGLGSALSDRRSGTAGEIDPVGDRPAAVLAGSCSARTLEQITHLQHTQPAFLLDALTTSDSQSLAAAALAFYDQQPGGSAPLIYSSLPPAELRAVQEAVGAGRAAAILEAAMGRIAQGLISRGVRRLIVAGGETSGSVVSALGVHRRSHRRRSCTRRALDLHHRPSADRPAAEVRQLRRTRPAHPSHPGRTDQPGRPPWLTGRPAIIQVCRPQPSHPIRSTVASWIFSRG